MPASPANILAGTADTADIQIPPPQPPSENNKHFSPSP
jgi:hypothetical protein